jgi:hypothetical protein
MADATWQRIYCLDGPVFNLAQLKKLLRSGKKIIIKAWRDFRQGFIFLSIIYANKHYRPIGSNIKNCGDSNYMRSTNRLRTLKSQIISFSGFHAVIFHA